MVEQKLKMGRLIFIAVVLVWENILVETEIKGL